MLLLALRIVLAPLLVGVATLVQRCWGDSIGGRVVGLPLTAAPLLALIAAASGPRFTSHVVGVDQMGDVAATSWCVTYALAARRLRPAPAFILAGGVFAAVSFTASRVHLSLLPATALAAGVLVLTLLTWPNPGEAGGGVGGVGGGAGSSGESAEDRRDLTARLIAAAVFTFAISETASCLGATVAGSLGALPLVTMVVAVAVHHRSGGAAVGRFMSGVMNGSFSVIAFLAALGWALPLFGSLPAFALALIVAFLAQLIRGERIQTVGRRLRFRINTAPQRLVGMATQRLVGMARQGLSGVPNWPAPWPARSASDRGKNKLSKLSALRTSGTSSL